MNLTLPTSAGLIAKERHLAAVFTETFDHEKLPSLGSKLAVPMTKLLSEVIDGWSEYGFPEFAVVDEIWRGVCSLLNSITRAEHTLTGAEARKRNRLRQCRTELADLMRYLIVARPDWNFSIPESLTAQLLTVRVSPLAYLWAVWNLFWSALRHPLSNTTIDLSTGRVLYRA
jgi:hypothetical protein